MSTVSETYEHSSYSYGCYSKFDLGFKTILGTGLGLCACIAIWKDQMNDSQKIICSVVAGSLVGVGSIGAIANRCLYNNYRDNTNLNMIFNRC